MIPSPVLARTGERVTDQNFDSLRTAFGGMRATTPVADGALVAYTATAGSAQVVEHGLGRVPRGVQVVDVELAAGATAYTPPFRRVGETLTLDRVEMYFATAGDYQLWVW